MTSINPKYQQALTGLLIHFDCESFGSRRVSPDYTGISVETASLNVANQSAEIGLYFVITVY